MPITSTHHTQDVRRKHRTRTRLAVHKDLPRLSVHRSLRHISAQIIDDMKSVTVTAASDYVVTGKATKTEVAAQVGTILAEKALAAGITAVRFDRGAYRYHGRVAALADAARSAGLTF